MDELAQARVALTLLEEEARKLLARLRDVRAAIATQRTKIDALSRSSVRPSIINRLPTEILVLILDLDVHTHRHRKPQKQTLASVCRRWRDVILQTPCFWSTIYVTSDAPWINTHLERSRGALLDIVIEGSPSSPSEHLALIPGLDTVMACAHRWHSLLVTNINSFSDGEREEDLMEFIGDRFKHLHFPSLKSVAIASTCDIGDLEFLSIAHAPALEHLELEEFMTLQDSPSPVAMLKALRLHFEAGRCVEHLPCWRLVPTQALTKLSLSGDSEPFSYHPNSLYFPYLVLLEMERVNNIRPILDAIVAPNLKEVNCFECLDSPSVTLSGSRSKFASVRQLSFSSSMGTELRYGNVVRFCEAFPGVHHVELDGGDWPYLFEPPSSQPELGRNSDIRYPMDLWTELKSLTFNGLHSEWLKNHQPMAWLVHRRALSPQQLHVKVNGFNASAEESYQRSISAYESLKENCILELDGLSSVDFPLPEDFSSIEVSSFHITSSCNSTCLDLAFTGASKTSV
ncbi:hypothetical protein SCLCIDRAFT_205906 [Scleroderma citrinum Foug A]|uniref:F-box domain-containing protein n=1 Tax=Scleroderma citrinum Foug A TaxID=1036808 RepID=A0A0C3D7R6_9AGAM|nr:hypothetical protein SCLCIDRAFT_205906 [Scleroderma citrinum Foug A]